MARIGLQRPVQRYDQWRGEPAVEGEAGEHGRPGRIARSERGLEVERRQQLPDERAHAGQRHAIGGRRLGEAMAGQVERDDLELLGQRRSEVAERMG